MFKLLLFILSLFLLNIFVIVINSQAQQNSSIESVKLSFTKLKDELRVTWYTIDEMNSPTVLYNTEMFNPDGSETSVFGSKGESISYDLISGYYGYPTTALMTELLPSTVYYYSVGDKLKNEWSPVYNFTTRSDINTPKDQVIPFSSCWFGDMGWMEGNGINSDIPTVDNVLSISDQLSFITHVGDISYANNDKNGNQTIWNLFLNSISPLTSHTVYNVVPGNHDLLGYGLSVYRKTWQMPSDKSSASWYSYDYNGVHFIGFSSESDYFPLSEQYLWIENDLKQFRKANPTSFIVAFSHRPFYCSVVWDWCDNENVSEGRKLYTWSLEELLYRYNVDLFISGHVHAYEKTKPVYKNEIMGDYSAPKATVHIIVGTGGNREGEDLVWQSVQPWTETLRTSINGYGLLNIVNSTTLNWRFFANINNTIVEEFYITKGYF